MNSWAPYTIKMINADNGNGLKNNGVELFLDWLVVASGVSYWVFVKYSGVKAIKLI